MSQVKLTLYLTLDWYIRNWQIGPGDGQLWACIQPQVVCLKMPKKESAGKGEKKCEIDYTPLVDWICGSQKTKNFLFQVVGVDDEKDQYVKDNEPIPVNFPDDANLILKLWQDDDLKIKLKNDRSDWVKLKIGVDSTSKQFTKDNHEPGLYIDELIHIDEDASFPKEYNRNLREAFAACKVKEGKCSDSKFATPLLLALWGGGRRNLRKEIFQDLPPNIMHLGCLPQGDQSDDFVITNLHSLNGLLFPIGTNSPKNLEKMKGINRVEMIIEDESGKELETILFSVKGSKVEKDINDFFSVIDRAEKYKESLPSRWDPEEIYKPPLHKRVYSIDNYVAFPFLDVVYTGEKRWYGSRQEYTQNSGSEQFCNQDDQNQKCRTNNDTGSGPLVHDVKRIIVQFHDPIKSGVHTFHIRPDQLKWQAYRRVEANLIPYRQFVRGQRESGLWVNLLRLVPTTSSQGILYEYPIEDGLLRTVEGEKIDELQLIGSYDFPWDDPVIAELGVTGKKMNGFSVRNKTILYWHEVESEDSLAPTNVLIFFPLKDRDRDVVFTTNLAKPSDPDNPIWEGPLKEETYEVPDVLDTLLLQTDVEIGYEAGNLKRLVPSVMFKSDVNFQFAQSISQIEGGLSVQYPHFDAGGQMSVENVFTEDLVNYNALNVYVTSPIEGHDGQPCKSRYQHLNPFKEIFPQHVPEVKEEDLNITQNFHFRQTEKMRPSSSDEPHEFFQGLYKKIGQFRYLTFDVEHTYGPVIPLNPSGWEPTPLSTHFDFPPILPTEIKAQNEEQSGEHFMTIKFIKEETKEKAILMFDLNNWLAESGMLFWGKPKNQAPQVAVWQSVAEMAHSQEIILQGRFLAFNFHRMYNGDFSLRNRSLASALEEVDLPEHERDSWVITDLLKPVFQEWLRTPPEPQAEGNLYEIEIELTRGKPWIASTCDVVEFFLKCEREKDRLANEDKDWELVRLKKIPSGKFLIDKENEGLQDLFGCWLEGLKCRRTAIEPWQKLKEEEALDEDAWAQKLRKRIGQSDENDSGAWIIPNEGKPPTDQTVVPVVCPIAFVPLAQTELLGQETSLLLKRFFRVLSENIECGIEEWREWDKGRWDLHFKRLSKAEKFISDIVDDITQSAKDGGLLYPIPKHDSESVQKEVKKVASELMKGKASEVFQAVQEWIRGRLWRDLGLFDENKAFLFVRLFSIEEKGEEFKIIIERPIPGELFQFESKKLIEPVSQIDSSTLEDRSILTVREALGKLVGTSWFGFVDVLSSKKYDSEFQYQEEGMVFRNFSSIIAQMEKVSEISCTGCLSIKDDLVYLPSGPQNLKEEPKGDSLVWLASRNPISPPLHIFTGEFQYPTKRGLEDIWSKGSKYDLNDLKRGKVNEIGEDLDDDRPYVVLSAIQKNKKPEGWPDHYTISAIFEVQGDEDNLKTEKLGTDKWWKAFVLDKIFVDMKLGPRESIKSGKEDPLPPTVSPFFKALAKEGNPKLFDRVTEPIDQFYDPDDLDKEAEILPWVQRHLGPVAPARPMDVCDKVAIEITEREKCKKEEEELECLLEYHSDELAEGAKVCIGVPKDFSYALEVLLFRSPPKEEGMVRRWKQISETDTTLLVINIEVPVWFGISVGLIQSRNWGNKGVPGKDMANEFGQVSERISDSKIYQPVISRSFKMKTINNPCPLARGDYNVKKLISDVIRCLSLAENVRLPSDDSFKNTFLSITINHDQTRRLPQTYIKEIDGEFVVIEPQTAEKFIAQELQCPLKLIRAGDSYTDKEIDWLPEPYNFFVLDFQWTNQQNEPFFRMSDIYVTVLF